MDYLVYVMWNDEDGSHEEYHKCYTLDDAKQIADWKAEDFKKKDKDDKIKGFCVMIYEATNY